MDFVLERLYREGSNSPPEKIILNEPGGSYTCGRGRENHILCLSMVVSRKHCIFFHSNDSLYVSDLQSSNGIFINGKRQKSLQMIKLCPNDIIGIGCSDNDADNDHNLLYIYKVCVIKSPLDEEAENSILSKTVLNNGTMKMMSAPHAENSLKKECNSNALDCDMNMPCKELKYEDSNFHNSRISDSKEISSDGDNQSSYNNNNNSNNNNSNINNTRKTKSDICVKIDDDIEIIHTSFTKKTNIKFNANRDSKSAKCLDSNSDSKLNSKFNYDKKQYSAKLPKNCKTEMKMHINVTDNENNDSHNSARNVNKLSTIERASNSLDKTNDTTYFAKSSNHTYTKDQVVKLEDEMQMTDDEEAPINNKIHDATPIKLKKVKHELKTRFSLVDVVNLSDDEDGVFPYSQLFDIRYENDAENKVEIKQECIDNDDQNNEKIGLLNVDDEIIILTDDEDGNNPWLERLSRSQLLNEDKKPEMTEAIVKNEIDLGIWENDEIWNIMQSEVPHTSKLPDSKETSLTSHASKKRDAKCRDIKNADSSAAKIMDSMDISDINRSNDISLEKTDYTSKRKTDTKHVELNKRMKKSDNLSKNLAPSQHDLMKEPDEQIKEHDPMKEPDDPMKEPDDLMKEFDDLMKGFDDPIKKPDGPMRKPDDPIKGFDDPIKEPDDPIKEPDDPIKEHDDPMKEHDDPMKEHDDPMKELDDLMKGSDDPIKEPDYPMKEHDDPMKELDDLRREPDDPRREPDDPMEESDDLMKELDDLMKESDDLMKEPDIVMKEPDDFTEEPKNMSIEGTIPVTKSVTRCSVTTSKKLIPVIEAQPMKKNRTMYNKEKQKEVQKQTEERSNLIPEKKTLKLQSLKEQVNEKFYGKRRKRHKVAHKPAADCSSPSEMKFITKEKKKAIIEMRKAKLKELAEEEKRLTTDSDKIVKRGTAKPKAKISLKNRGDFLITEGEAASSKLLSDKSTKVSLKSSDDRFEDPPTKKTRMEHESMTSDTKIQKLHRDKSLSKSMNNIATSLQQFLHLDDIVSPLQITEESNIQEPKTVDKEKKPSSSKEKKRHEIASKSAKTSELSDKSVKRVSILVQKENFSPNSGKSKLVHNQVKSSAEPACKQKKRVSFSENVDIKHYEIETKNSLKKLVGKDAPIPTNKLAKTLTTTAQWQCPKLEEFLGRIFLWNPVWLEEQRYLNCMPPIVKDRELQPMKLSYTSYREYYTVAMPLLLLEIWYTMIKDFDNVEKNMQRVTAMCSVIESSIKQTPIPSTNLFLTTLTIEVLVEKEDLNKQTHPIYGDLVLFEYVTNQYGKQTFHKVFAYVVNMQQTIITDFTYYNKDLRNYVNNPYAVVTYTLLMRSLEHEIVVNRVQRVRTVTYLRASIRMVQALQYLPQSSLLNSILNPRIENYRLPPMNEMFISSLSRVTEDNLNPKQLEAVYRVSEAVLRKEAKLCFIQGPPGTGKSKVIINLVSRILYDEQKNRKSLRILVCAPSNAATDEIVLRLLAVRSSFKPKRFNMVRIGRPESMHPQAKSISITELAKRYIQQTANQPSNIEEIMDLQTRINSLQNTLASSHTMSDIKKKEIEKKMSDLYVKYDILKLLNGKTWDEINAKVRAKAQRLSEDRILMGADVITCTLSSCYTNQMESIFGGNKNRISVCIVDEATQSCEAETLIPLMLGVNTLVLVGDPNQLPATILSQQAKKLGLDQSVFSRIQNVFTSQPNNPIIMLNTQYRMDYAISYWPNKYFYDGKLMNATSTRMRFPFHSYRVLNHNSAQNDNKFSNTTEAQFVANIIFSMLAFAKWDNLSECVSIGVLTPYNIQRTLVLNKINEKISPLPESLKKKINFEVNTVDGFQGQERDIIIMSCVRSHGIGFLSDKQRLCVALTRAKHSLILCGNFNTFKRDPMWKALLSDAQSRGILCNIDAQAQPINIKKFIIK